MSDNDTSFVSRGGQKLQTALEAFKIDVRGWTCADFGANVGGFTDCLLQRGSVKVFAIDTGYGELAWKLRKDPRVVVMERTNALYADLPEEVKAAGGVDLVTIDVAFTPQRLIIPAAQKWLKPLGGIVSLLKPYYELSKQSPSGKPPARVEEAQAHAVCRQVCRQLAQAGWGGAEVIESPLRGKGGNLEFLLYLKRGISP
jgi:23S rRNA (cytidine1920-2'-O)/16S rRNA (cytidine1409-2'-O)-methyltransferase